jgi:nicotinate dehydrogenase subunit B
MRITRRGFLASGGALVVSFSLAPSLLAQQKPPSLPGSLKDTPLLDAWIRIDAKGAVTVFTGKVELGQGIKTALKQIASDELAVDFGRITLVTADTGATPNEGYTAGSQSMQDSGTALRHAAAQAREILIAQAAARFDMQPERLAAKSGAVVADNGRSISYAELVNDWGGEQRLHVEAKPESKFRDAAARTAIGKPVPRVDIPPKLAGAPMYVQDVRLPDMVHARVVRPSGPGARLKSVDAARVEKLPGVLKVVRDGSFLAVIAEREFQAVTAMRALSLAASWEDARTLPVAANLYAGLQKAASKDFVILGAPVAPAFAGKPIESTYRRPYQMHASIGPSCAVAQMKDGELTLWTHSQGVFPLRGALAEMLRMPPERIRCIHVEGAGCYGHNGADDAAADAALLAVAFPNRPVRLQWMRDQEHAWEPYGAAMVATLRASLDGGGIVQWQHDVWTPPHNTRPGRAGNLLAATHLQNAFTPPAPAPIPQPAGGGDRNAIPLYRVGNARVVHHFIAESPLRVSALRALGGYTNVFAIESFMDELAKAANADPVEFRLKHLDDPRAQDVIREAATRFGWSAFKPQRGGGRLTGRGFGFARYKNLAGYAAVAMEVQVERETGQVRVLRAVAAADSGEVVNPDGIRNQIEGGIIQSISWTLHEAVEFDAARVLSRDWSTYPILRFSGVPERVDVHVVDRPGQPFLGTGEAAQGPAAGALANALADATGVRIRELPLSARRVKAALGT